MANPVVQHPLVRDGRSQTDRLNLHALAPESVSLDDRQERQLLVYLNEFAKSVAFYDTDDTPERNQSQSNWQSFFKSGSSVQVSLIEAFDVTGFENQFNKTKQNFKEGLVRNDYGFVFDFLFESALTINAWYDALSSDIVLLDNQAVLNETPLRRTIGNLISSNLKSTLAQLIATANLFVSIKDDKGYRVPDLSSLYNNGFWDLDPSVLASCDTVLISLNHRPLEKERLLRERLDEIFQVFAKSIRQIVVYAAQQDILQATKTHEPHLALLYTFLRLLRPVLADFNQLPKRHLDFYYREVLKLTEKKAIPDTTHVIFELPRNTTPQYKIDANTLLKDGKDAKGQDIRFALNNEIVVNRAQVAELRTLTYSDKYLHAIQKANTENPDVTGWEIMGSGGDQTFDLATIGFAIVSPTLVLEKGKREVKVTLTFDADPNILMNNIEGRLSGQKGWMPFIEKNLFETKKGLVNQLVITFVLNVKDDPIAAADPSVLGVNYDTPNAAVLQLFLKKDVNSNLYKEAKELKIKAVEITATVSELQNVKICTDEGDQDPTKPFMPFGAIPSVGSTFSIGSDEIFSKKLTKLRIDFEWDKLPKSPAFSNFEDYYKGYDIEDVIKPTNETLTALSYFLNGNEAGTGVSRVLFASNPIGTVIDSKQSFLVFENAIPSVVGDLLEFKLNNSDFRHLVYPKLLAAHTMASAKADGKIIVLNDLNTTRKNLNDKADNAVSDTKNWKPDCTPNLENSNVRADKIRDEIKVTIKNELDGLVAKVPTIINPPYTPIIKNLTVSYTAKDTEAQLFHIYPFDEGANFKNIDLSTPDPLIFDFKQKIDSNTPPYEQSGALFIGLTNAVENSLQSLLFQLLESSGSTYLPKAKIDWYYLDGNNWQLLEKGKHILNDATNEFIQSGIIDIILPLRGNSKMTTILPPQYYWLKATTKDDLGALCRAIGVHAQAVKATFQLTELNDTARLSQPLAAQSVSKLDVADANVKSVTQLYASFDGQPSESSSTFYRRVSERLKHKGRAATLYDYEQLVLEAFPEVFKVKCIPHTFSNQRKNNAQKTADNDIHLAPNHVTVVVVPNILKTQNAANQLFSPTSSRGLLERIAAFLKKRTSPFVQLQVLNPIYDKIYTTFKVHFKAGKSPEFYREQLQKDIDQFLAPWAFNDQATVTFGGIVYRSSILGFIENRDYVDYVIDFIMFQESEFGVPKDFIQATSERVVLTTLTLGHEVEIIGEKSNPMPLVPQRGIGFDWQIVKK